MSEDILQLFPKKRIDLPPEYQAIYDQHYLSNRNGQYATTSLSQRLEGWMHKKIAQDISEKSDSETLEIGAGTLNQLAYEKGHFAYDIVEPYTLLFEDSPELTRIRTVFKDISDIQGTAYDRITTIATFEHIMDLPLVVAHSTLLLKVGGHLRVAIPNEGTFLWWLGTRITGFEFKRKYGLDYDTLMRFEHVNTADDIENVLKCFFDTVDCSVFGLSRAFAFYRFLDCSGPKKEKAREYLRTRAA